jgi:hypothetical protein
LGFRFRLAQEILANFFRDIRGNRARMGFLFGNAVSRQKVDNGLGLDLKFAG